MAGQTITISVLADTKKFSSAMRNFGDATGLNKLGGMAKKTAKALGVVTLAGGAALGGLAKVSVDAASSLEQSIGGVDAIFKDQSGKIHTWATKAAGDVGLSKNAYNELAAIIGTTLKNSGTPMDELAGKTNGLIKTSADLAATFGGTVTDSANAMASALRGEFEPLRRYGVSLSQADIQARALADSGKKSVKELTKQEKAVATQALILEQSADAQGAFAREANTLAGQQERLKAKFENVKATLGTKLLPVMTKVTTWVSDRLDPAMEGLQRFVDEKVTPAIKSLAGWFKDNEDKIKALAEKISSGLSTALQGAWDLIQKVVEVLKNLGTWAKDNKDWLLALGVAVGTMVLAWNAWTTALAVWKAAVLVGTAVQTAFNAVLAANPIGIIVLAIAGLVAGLVFFFTKTETGKKVWAGFTAALSKGWETIKSAFSKGWEAVKSALQKTWDFVKKVWSYTPIGLITTNWGKITGFFSGIPGKIKGYFDNAISWLKTAGKNIFTGLKNGATETWSTVWTWIKERPGKIKDTFSNAGEWLKTAGKNTFNGLKSGFTDAWTKVTSWLKERPGAIKDTFSNAGTWLLDAGKNVINGLKNGVLSVAGNIGSWIVDKVPGPMKSAVKKALGIHSPSKVFHGYGVNIIQGLVNGLDDNRDKVKSSIEKIVAKIRDTKGLSDAKKSSLVTYVKAQGKALDTAWKNAEKAASKLKSAQEKLATMKADKRAMRDQVASSLMGQVNLSDVIARDDEGNTLKGKTTIKNVRGYVQGLVSKFKALAERLGKLRNAGLPASLVEHIAGLGPEDGVEVADAILKGSKTEIKALSNDWAGLEAWSKSAGNQVASSMFDVGIQAQEGLVKGLEKNAKKTEAAARKLARNLATWIRKELGIKSPSRVMASLAAWIPAGLAKGIKAKEAVATTAMRRLAADVSREASFDVDPTVSTPKSLNLNGPGTLARNDVANVTINVNAGVGDPVEIGRQVDGALRSFYRMNGIR
ncbi:phage tail protein [Sanguibacter massiliensis]|uniref:phage tail protein n=1 Tax=Sanguibacter massiliensis TaxID=1973217 RepID=UPI000C8574B9|nr:hypothetical protein [Sanguibacter massiliensis]